MGLVYRRSRRIDPDTRVNYGTGGVSVTRRFGPVTVNSRGRITIKILPGLSWRIGR